MSSVKNCEKQVSKSVQKCKSVENANKVNECQMCPKPVKLCQTGVKKVINCKKCQELSKMCQWMSDMSKKYQQMPDL